MGFAGVGRLVDSFFSFHEYFVITELVRRSMTKWKVTRYTAKRASEPIKEFTKAWELTHVLDYQLDGTRIAQVCVRGKLHTRS